MTLAPASSLDIKPDPSLKRSDRRLYDYPAQSSSVHPTAAAAGVLLPSFRAMDLQQQRSASGSSEYPQSGLPSPYPSNGDNHSEASSSADQNAASYSSAQDVRSNSYAAQPTPTTSEYAPYPTSARSSTFSERTFHPHPASSHSGSSGGGAGLAQTPTNPSIPASSPTYSQQYSPFPAATMEHGYPSQSGSANIYAHHRPDWPHFAPSPYGQATTPVTPNHGVFTNAPATAVGRSHQVYSFVTLPGAQQHKRPRRRYEEIERMYKCGWNNCEKAYGTLNHLNAHVTMQAHGQKRTPDQFKEIRKEWKIRKKEEDAARKAAEEQQRQAAASASAVQNAGPDGQAGSEATRLPPIGSYASSQYPPPTSASMQAPQAPSGYAYANYTNTNPDQPYGSGSTMYSTQR